MEYSIEEQLEEQMKINKILQQKINKVIKLLGKYKHYYLPEPEQNSKNEDIVMTALSILKSEGDE